MFLVLFFAKVSFIKYVPWNKPNFIDSKSPLYAAWEKNGATKAIDYAFGQTHPFSFSYPHTYVTDGTQCLFKMPVLFVLRYIRYKGCVKRAINCNFKCVKCIFLFTFFSSFSCFLKWNLRCNFKCNIECLRKFTFYWIVIEFRTSKCTNMCIFKCNSIVTWSAPLYSTSSVGVPSDEPSEAPSTALTCSYLSAKVIKQKVKCIFFVLYCAYSIAFKSNIKSTINCTLYCSIRPMIKWTILCTFVRQ